MKKTIYTANNLNKIIILLCFINLLSCKNQILNDQSNMYILAKIEINDKNYISVHPYYDEKKEKTLTREECVNEVENITKIKRTEWTENSMKPIGNFTYMTMTIKGVKSHTLLCVPLEKWISVKDLFRDEKFLKKLKRNSVIYNSLKSAKYSNDFLEKMSSCGLDIYGYYNIPVIYNSPFICDNYNENNKIKTTTIFNVFPKNSAQDKYVMIYNLIKINQENLKDEDKNLIGFTDIKNRKSTKIIEFSGDKDFCLSGIKKELNDCGKEGNLVLGSVTCKRKNDYIIYSCINKMILLDNIKDIIALSAGDLIYKTYYLDNNMMYKKYPNIFLKSINENSIQSFEEFPFNN